jgi:hypothetical protein
MSPAGRASGTVGEPPTLLADAGVEIVNERVDELIDAGLLRRVLAMTEIRASNSMIEAVADPQAPVAVPPLARFRGQGASARRVLRGGAQRATTPLGIRRADAGRDVLWSRLCRAGPASGRPEPPYSPELNPIENLWHFMKSHYTSNRAYDDYDHLLDAIGESWRALTKKRLRSVCRCDYLTHEQMR